MKVRGEFGVCLADPREVVIGHKQDQPQERSDMISKTARPCTVVLAALLYATTAFAQENRGTSEQKEIRPQRCVSIGFRAKRRPAGASERVAPLQGVVGWRGSTRWIHCATSAKPVAANCKRLIGAELVARSARLKHGRRVSGELHKMVCQLR